VQINLAEGFLLVEFAFMNEEKKAVTGSGKASSVEYTLNHVGCYVDSARGIYAIDAIARFAKSHGYDVRNGMDQLPLMLSDYEFAGELEDEIDDYMNRQFDVEGAFWGRNESGDWGLWEIDDYSQHAVN
jgi:hypothetical protein